MDNSLEHIIKNWWNDDRVHNYEALHALFVFTIWEARNRAVFQNTWNPSEIIEKVLLQKMMEHQMKPKSTPQRLLTNLEINKTIRWVLFDESSQGEPPLGGVGGVVYLKEKK